MPIITNLLSGGRAVLSRPPRHERVDTDAPSDEESDDSVRTATADVVGDVPPFQSGSGNGITNAADSEESGGGETEGSTTSTTTNSSDRTRDASTEEEASVSETSEDALTPPSDTNPATSPPTEQYYQTQRRMLELDEERELRRRRQSTCTLIMIFVLFRLWIEALAETDVGLMILCLLGTVWTSRWIRATREREEEVDRRIEEFFTRERAAGRGRAGAGEEGGNARMLPVPGGVGSEMDLSLMSFQAQLALAIIESQRQMIENGGHGNPDGNHSSDQHGVSEEQRARWVRYEYHGKEGTDGNTPLPPSSPSSSPPRSDGGRKKKRAGGYGSVSSVEDPDEDISSKGLEILEEGLVDCALNPMKKHSTSPSSPNITAKNNSIKSTTDIGGAVGVGDDFGSSALCSICLCDYEEGERIVRLPCSHVYHDECVSAWCTNHVRCPLCNFDLEQTSDLSSSSSSSSDEVSETSSPTVATIV